MLGRHLDIEAGRHGQGLRGPREADAPAQRGQFHIESHALQRALDRTGQVDRADARERPGIEVRKLGQTSRIRHRDLDVQLHRWLARQIRNAPGKAQPAARHVADERLAQGDGALPQGGVEVELARAHAAQQQAAEREIEIGVETGEHRQRARLGLRARAAAGSLRPGSLLPGTLGRGSLRRGSLRRAGRARGRQIGVQVQLVDGDPDTETRPLAQRHHDSAGRPADIHAQVDLAQIGLARRGLDLHAQAHAPQALGRYPGDIHAEPVEDAAQVVGGGLEAPDEPQLLSRRRLCRGELAGQRHVRAAGQQRQRLAHLQPPLGERHADQHLANHLAAIDQRVDGDLERGGDILGQRKRRGGQRERRGRPIRGRGRAGLPARGRRLGGFAGSPGFVRGQKLVQVETRGRNNDPGVDRRPQLDPQIALERGLAEAKREIGGRHLPRIGGHLGLELERPRQDPGNLPAAG